MKSCSRNSCFPMWMTGITIVFLYIPLVMVAIASFNDSKYGGAWRGFTLRWYNDLFHNATIWTALINTLIIAVAATFFSTILGTMSALALHRMRGKFKLVYDSLVQTSLVVPDILQGISLLLLFILFITACGDFFKEHFGITLELGFTTVIIAHVTFCMAYVTMVVLSRLKEFDNSLLEAAQDLGAGHIYTFFHVTLPVISPGVIAGALFAFTLSIDDFVITFFVKGAGDSTLPIYIENSIRRGSVPVLNALSVIFLIVTFVLVFVTQKILSTKNNKDLPK